MVRTEDQLKVKKTQDAIEKFKNKIIGEFCSLVRTKDQFKVKKTQDAIEKFENKIIGEVVLTFLMHFGTGNNMR